MASNRQNKTQKSRVNRPCVVSRGIHGLLHMSEISIWLNLCNVPSWYICNLQVFAVG